MDIKIPKAYTPSEKDLPNVIAPAGVEVNANYLKIGDYYAKTFFILTYPRFLASGWFSPIINLPEMMDISVFVHPMDTALALKNLRKKVAEIEAEMIEQQEKGVVRDPMLETAHSDVETLRDSLQQSRERLFQVGVYITLYAPDLKKLQKVETLLTSILESKLVYIKPAIFRQPEGLNSVFPLGTDVLSVLTPLNSGPAASLFPFVSPELSSEKGILYGVNMHNNSLIIFDRFSLENANSVVFAKSGSGKSYATKLQILRSLMMGINVIVIDPENEYQNLCDAIGGSYFRISLTSQTHINPFDIPIIPEGEEPADVFRSHVLNVSGLVKLMVGDISAEEDAILDRVILETYASRDITPDNFSSMQNLTPPLLEDLQTVLDNTDGGASMARRLEKYTRGSYAGFTNSATNIDIQNRLIVFSIRDLEDQLRPIAMYIILNFVWNIIRAKLRARLLVIDEAWIMMKFKDSAQFLFGLVKRARKYYLGVTTITQDVEDFLKSEFGKPIITNSSMQLLLKQSPASIEYLAKAFSLTEGEKMFLLEVSVGEGLFFAGLKHVAIRIISSYTEEQIITTNPEQLLAAKGLS